MKSDLHSTKQRTAPGAVNTSSAPLISPTLLFNVFRRYWKFTLPVGLLLAAAAAAAVYSQFVPLYRANNWLRIRPQQFVAYTSPQSDGFLRTYVQLLRSPIVLDEVVQRPEVARLLEVQNAEDKVAALASRIGIDSVGNSEIYHVAYVSPNPENAAKIVDVVTEVFLEKYAKDEDFETKQLLGKLDEEMQRIRGEVQRRQEAVRQLSITYKGNDPLGPGNGVLQPLTLEAPLRGLQSNLIHAQVETITLEARILVAEQLAARDTRTLTDYEIEQVLAESPLALEVERKRARIAEFEKVAAPGAQVPEVVRLQLEVREAEAKLAEERSRRREELKKEFEAKRVEVITAMKQDLETRKVAEEALKKEYEQKLQTLRRDSKELLEVQIEQAELDRHQKTLDTISERAFRVKTEMYAQGRIHLLKPATVPLRPIELVPTKKILMASSVAFVIPLLLAFGWEQLYRRVGTAQELKEVSNVPVVGEIATLPAVTVAPNFLGSRKRRERHLNLFRESIDSLRTNLLLAHAHNGMQVLLVTSAVNSEGKTSVSSQLAVSVAAALGEPTLLIDADLRRPDVHNIFEIPREPGLADVLAGRVPLAQAIHRDYGGNLHLMPAGKLRCSPHKLIGGGEFAQMLAQLRKDYPFIIVDTAPVLSASESLAMAQQADSVLVCTMRDVSRFLQVKMAYERLSAVGAQPVGVVLNGVSTSSYSYYYGSYDYSVQQS